MDDDRSAAEVPGMIAEAVPFPGRRELRIECRRHSQGGGAYKVSFPLSGVFTVIPRTEGPSGIFPRKEGKCKQMPYATTWLGMTAKRLT